MNTPYKFNPHQMVRQIVLVGVGGTGSILARHLARILVDLRARRHHLPSVLLVDPDRVEQRNIGRQSYTAADIGEYKCRVLGTRLNFVFGLDMAWACEPLDADKHIERGAIVLGAVDNYLVASQSFCARLCG